MPRLLTHATADGAGPAVRVQPEATFAQPGAPISGTVYVDGTFDGATVIIEARPADGDGWLAVPGSAMTAPGMGNLGVYAYEIRANVSGAGATTDLTATLVSPERSEVL